MKERMAKEEAFKKTGGIIKSMGRYKEDKSGQSKENGGVEY